MDYARDPRFCDGSLATPPKLDERTINHRLPPIDDQPKELPDHFLPHVSTSRV